MHKALLVGLLTASISACGKDTAGDDDGADAPSGNFPPPRIIAGGGIGDGAIDGVVNLYVIDDATRAPVSGATVRVGTIDGTTDATGLFVARGVVGPQTVAVKAGSYRSDVWIGANGANITVNLEKANVPAAPFATLTGQITGFTTVTVAAGHAKDAIVAYAQTDEIGEADNEIPQLEGSNGCFVRGAAEGCTFSIRARVGRIALVAAIFDRDLKGTPSNFDDDTLTLIRWAYLRGVTTTANATQPNMDLALLAPGQQQTVFVDFGSPPLAFAGALVGIELGDEGVLQLPTFATRANNTLIAPRPDALGATSYRLTAISSDAEPATKTSIVLRRNLASSTVAAGAWMAIPSGASVTRQGGSWTRVPDATVHTLEYAQGGTRALSVTVLDGTSSVTIPDLIQLPSGSLTASVNAIGAPGLDVTDFSLDRDAPKLVQVGNSIAQL